MVIEAVAAASCKATFPIMGSAWAITLCEGEWMTAAVVAPSLAFVAVKAWQYPGRLRGKRAEAPP